MKKGNLILMLCTILIAIPLVQSASAGQKGVEQWYKDFSLRKQNVTRLHFYFHDNIAPPSQSAYQVFESSISSVGMAQFGRGYIFDNPLTVGPELQSMRIGRGQGLSGAASLQEPRLLMNLNLVFTQGDFNGSTLQVLGTNPILNPDREMSIVGGTGAFRLARGIATAQPYFFNATSTTLEFNLIVLHC